ncbi:HNH endonuclease, partial [Microbacterium mangrovi]
HAAGVLLGRAEALLGRYRAAFSSLSGARMTPRHAELLVLLLDQVPDPGLRDRLIGPAVELAETEPVGTFRRRVKALIEKEQAPTLTERHQAAITRRRVWIEDDVDGMAWTHLYGPAVEARAAFDRATRIGKTIQKAETAAGTTDPRSLDQVRADVYGDLLVAGVVTAHPKTAQRIRAQVVVTVPVLSLLDDAYANAPGAEPAVVEGVGPIPIQKARELAGGAKEWIRVLTHPETGIVLSIGRDRYKVPKPLRQAVTWRAGRCLTPGCGMPANRCQIDHRIEWQHGGETALTNLNPFCTNHHIIKTVTGWRIEQAHGGAVTWISPTRRAYTVHPERTLPAFTLPPDP